MKKILITILLISSLIFIAACNNKSSANLDDFAKCLTANGTSFYGAYWCPHCQRNKEMFGTSIKYIDYIECAIQGSNEENPVCTIENIKGYPTWKFEDNSKHEGEITLQQLATKTGCVLPK